MIIIKNKKRNIKLGSNYKVKISGVSKENPKAENGTILTDLASQPSGIQVQNVIRENGAWITERTQQVD